MIRSDYATGRYAVSEDDFILGSYDSWTGANPKAVIFCHGYGATAASVFVEPSHRRLLDALGRTHTVHVGDLGGQTFANPTGITRVGQAIDSVVATRGVDEPVVLVGASMGAGLALAFAKAYPARVAAVAAIIPNVDLQSVIDRFPATYGPAINAAYGGIYDDATHGPNHSAVRFAASMDASIPIRLWGASDDPLVDPADVAEFVSLRPQTEFTNLGPLGHSPAAIDAARPTVVEWVRSHL